MYVLVPITITDAVLTDSNIAETDHSAWSGATTYAVLDRVISTTTHKIYESVQGANLNHAPTTDDGTWWIEVSATEKWMPFDSFIEDAVSNSTSITYELTMAEIANGIVFFGLAADSVTVTVTDPAMTQKNLLQYTEQFDNAFWSKVSGCAVTANATTDPLNGDAVADLMYEDTSTGAHRMQGYYSSASIGLTYVASIYVKTAGRDFQLCLNGTAILGTNQIANVSFSAETITAASGVDQDDLGIEAVGDDGWYRVWIRFTASATGTAGLRINLFNVTNSYTGDGSSGIYVFGAQMELSLTATSYQWVTATGTYNKVVSEETRDLVNNEDVIDWWTYLYAPIEYDTEAVFDAVPAYTGYVVDISIDAPGGTAAVGLIVIGKLYKLGDTLQGSRVGFKDYSLVETDDFGRRAFTERSYARGGDFDVAVTATDVRRVQRLLASIRTTECAWFHNPSQVEYGTVLFGRGLVADTPLSFQGKVVMQIEVEGTV